ncbi:DUF6538 domain-containing protein [Neoroseomonas soli]|uniref:Site-specific integrase n=1 Tax=Neoroseomonas soli TaxID=1081025 RepID=A0A9X9WSK0_9PROT|nr:DUF6538 domain-containing protein [Neoroseomonas soli]MBR0670129.1 site-specific integrase [Neoroseomonas soli]
MSRPFKHPVTGVYYFRKAVPDDLREAIGKREVKVSLKTKHPTEARSAYAKVAAEVANHWKVLRSKPEPLTHKQIIALAGLAYADLVAVAGDEPNTPTMWEHVLRLHREAAAAGKLEQWVGPVVDQVLMRAGVKADDRSRARLIEAVDRALTQAAEYLKRLAEGDYRPDPNANRFPEWSAPQPAVAAEEPSGSKGSITGLLEDWWNERKATDLAPATYESYRATIRRFVRFIGHDDLARVTADDVLAYKDKRLQEVNPRTGKPVSAKTVKDSDLSGLKSVFNWAVTNRRMISNPAANITIKIGKKPKLRSRGLSDDEATSLLRAAWHLKQSGERMQTYQAKRWVPWLCAYTGARVGEMAQLRKQDVRQEGDHWVIKITPEAGRVKNKEARDVVLHQHIVDLGFPEFVGAAPAGHLFLKPAADGDVRGPWRGLKNRVTEFVRTVVTDPNVQPNHGWRHRFKTVAREVGIPHDVMDAIVGHEPGTVGADYGEFSPVAQARAMALFPRYDIGLA